MVISSVAMRDGAVSLMRNTLLPDLIGHIAAQRTRLRLLPRNRMR